MPTKYDLAQLADQLGTAHPQIEALYLFGSRRFKTRSIRSDVDVLVATNGYVKPADLRDFSESHCPALDIFVLKDGRATSCQNESFIEAASVGELIKRLDAVKFWQRNGGRQAADITWQFELRDDVEYVATALPNGAFPSKRKAIEEMTIAELVGSLRPSHLYSVIAALVAIIAVAFGAGHWVGKNLQPKEADSQKVDDAVALPKAIPAVPKQP